MPTSFPRDTTTEPGLLPIDPAAQAAHWSELAEQYRAILDALPTAIGLVRDHRIVWVNQAFTTLLGYSREDTSRQPSAIYFHDVPQFEAAMREAEAILVQGQTYHRDFLMRRKNGECFWGVFQAVCCSPGTQRRGLCGC